LAGQDKVSFVTDHQIHPECVHLVAEFGTIPNGWTRDEWIKRLREVASACEPLFPRNAKRYRDWADKLAEPVNNAAKKGQR